ncbi:hypothetical protein GRI65_09135 [Altererythrobacter sediminis]|uniref:Uncharacterized protein n=2 Tax=Allopontixanthobacter sediminis TaxID=1689985 RepID=A0A845B2R4_9SPHN|nr:hypothetical protein [Allopontixanthobacter sediminis]
MNLAPIADWEPGFPFRNLFLGARPWLTRNLIRSGPHDTKLQGSFQFDRDGYPLQVPVASPDSSEPQTVFTYLPNCREPGNYILLYDGEGDIDGVAATKVISRKPGRLKLKMSQNSQSYEGLVIKRSVLGNHIRNIRLVREYDETIDLNESPFLPEFLEFCRPFHCLRFMEWGQTNNSLEENWETRKRPTFYTMVGKSGDPEATYGPAPTPFEMKFSGGVSIELMVQLCNTLKTDPWFCIPHRATDDYIAKFARLVRETLDPGLKVYLEYSNEVWNWGFHQAGWMLRSPLAGAIVEMNGGNAWKDDKKLEGVGHPERIGALFRRTFSIWEREWSGNAQRRLTRVCAVQAAWFDASKRTIQWCLDHGGADAVSPASYVGPDNAIYEKWSAQGKDLTPEMVINDIKAVIQSLRSSGSLAQTIAFGKQHGLTYVAYEAGQHIQAKDQIELPYSPALAAAQTHPEMYDLYVELLRLNRDLGCTLLSHFNSVGRQGTRWGSWGAKASYDAPLKDSPKMRALLDCNVTRN